MGGIALFPSPFFPPREGGNASIVREIGGFANNTTSRGQHLGVPYLLRNNSQQTKIECTRRARAYERKKIFRDGETEQKLNIGIRNFQFKILFFSPSAPPPLCPSSSS